MKTNKTQQSFLRYRSLALVLMVFALLAGTFPSGNSAQAAQENQFMIGSDGTLQVYRLTPDGNREENCKNYVYKAGLYASSDGGKTWQERGQQFNHNVVSVVSATADARAVYVLVADSPITQDNNSTYSIYFSYNAGQTWEKRYQGGKLPVQGCGADFYNQLRNVQGYATPLNVIEFKYNTRVGGSSGSDFARYVSIDGGRSFNLVGVENDVYHHLDYYYTPEGLVRFYDRETNKVTLSSDGGKSWQPLSYPDYNPNFTNCNSPLCAYTAMAYLPGQLFLYSKIAKINPFQYDQAAIFYSIDNGRSWQKVATGLVNLELSANAPTTATASNKEGNKLKLNLGDLDRFQTSPAVYNDANPGHFFSATGHNLSGPFKAFWDKNGGLAQFGYPKTEPFYEYNPADGKVYLAQYFERNRFEYHPENAGTQYEVLLGLLGNQLTAERRAKGDGAFNRFDNKNYPGGTYFPETGHNLRNSFKAYWEANGGLALYGYPISEEFEEVNPDDSKTYVVQYFERNRFEYHPENKGTKYEVLLGLLGNTLLKQRGWLPS
jgi:hypothetical protein